MTLNSADMAIECGICYTYRLPPPSAPTDEGVQEMSAHAARPTAAAAPTEAELDQGELPQEICKHDKCGRCFHRSCLLDWFRGLSDTKESYGVVFGKCPYCTSPLSVSMSFA